VGCPFFGSQAARVEETPQRAQADREVVLLPQAGAHLFQGEVVFRVDQAAQEGLVRVELGATGTPLRTRGHRPGRGERGHPADRRAEAHPKPRGRLPTRGRSSGIHHALAQILAEGSTHATLLIRSGQ
jgi:hypothetical protein